MTAKTPSETAYDVLVIGGGPAGENAADIAALEVALVEHELLGGECTYRSAVDALEHSQRLEGREPL